MQFLWQLVTKWNQKMLTLINVIQLDSEWDFYVSDDTFEEFVEHFFKKVFCSDLLEILVKAILQIISAATHF